MQGIVLKCFITQCEVIPGNNVESDQSESQSRRNADFAICKIGQIHDVGPVSKDYPVLFCAEA